MDALISLLVFSVGCLGVAGLQAASKGAQYEAAQRSRAAHIINDMAQRIQANPAVLIEYSDVKVGEGLSAPSARTCTSTNTCTATELATADIYNFHEMITGVSAVSGTSAMGGLFRGRGCVNLTPTGQIHITLSWRAMTPMAATTGGANFNADCPNADEGGASEIAYQRQMVLRIFPFEATSS